MEVDRKLGADVDREAAQRTLAQIEERRALLASAEGPRPPAAAPKSDAGASVAWGTEPTDRAAAAAAADKGRRQQAYREELDRQREEARALRAGGAGVTGERAPGVVCVVRPWRRRLPSHPDARRHAGRPCCPSGIPATHAPTPARVLARILIHALMAGPPTAGACRLGGRRRGKQVNPPAPASSSGCSLGAAPCAAAAAAPSVPKTGRPTRHRFQGWLSADTRGRFTRRASCRGGGGGIVVTPRLTP